MMGAHFKDNNKTLMGEIASFLNKKLSGIGAPSQPAALENAQEEGEEDEEDEEDEGAMTRSSPVSPDAYRKTATTKKNSPSQIPCLCSRDQKVLRITCWTKK